MQETRLRRANAAEFARNSRRAEFLFNAGCWPIEAHLNQGRQLGWDGACLESVSGFSHDPIGYRGGMDLYEYCGDDPTMYLDPAGTDWGEAPNVPGGPQCLSLGSCHRPGFNPFDPQPGPATPAPATPPPTPTPAPAAPTPVDCNKCGLWPVDQFRPSLCDCGNLGLLDRGCIGLCQIRMGLPGILDPQNAWGVRCFKSYGEARKVLLQLKKNSGCHPLLFAVQTTASGSATTTDPGRGEIDPGTIPIAPPATDPKQPDKMGSLHIQLRNSAGHKQLLLLGMHEQRQTDQWPPADGVPRL